jgi:ATP-dependent Lon protease
MSTEATFSATEIHAADFPVLPIRNTVIFPQATVPLRVGRPKSVAALEVARARGEGAEILILTQKPQAPGEPAPEQVTPSQLYRIGVVARIEKMQGNAETGYQVIVRATGRYHASQLVEATDPQGRTYIQAVLGAPAPDVSDLDAATRKALLESLKKLSLEVLELFPADTSQVAELVKGIEELEYLTHLAGGNMDLDLETRQKVLETVDLKARALFLLELLQKQFESLRIQTEIREKMSKKLGKNQREQILREQIRTIREELGDEADESSKADELRKRIDDAKLPEAPRKAALDELKRLESMGGQSPEANIIRTYIELILTLPWNQSASPAIDLARARETLDSDHSGLEKVKKRILEHLSVMKLRNSDKGSILLLVGPPGVGKTSLGQTIARALGRKYVRASLGGVRDESEIRGHRRTYIGAMPGRILQSLKRAGENNPVFVLDEIDKLSRGYAGDPGAALLEVLDPEQNASFQDHYLDLAFDLSKVFFIATANSLEGIPGPLLDRMEVIELSGYTISEKLEIAKSHLFKKQLADAGMKPGEVEISDEALLKLIGSYTRESGVRSLDRRIGELLRGVGAQVVDAREKTADDRVQAPVRIEAQEIERLVGPEKFLPEVAEEISPPGVVTGLAWTPVGGEILFIEATRMPGSGKLTLTGQLGDVMKESAQIALSLIRSRLPELTAQVEGLGFDYEKQDLHLHVPAGAIPKDGPSAGVAMLVTLASLITGRRVDPKLAMTGEISLRGMVMPVGGIKEKVIAAHRAGISKVLLPHRNRKDWVEVPEEVRSALHVEWVSTAEEVLKSALGLTWRKDPGADPFPKGTPSAIKPDAAVEGIFARW